MYTENDHWPLSKIIEFFNTLISFLYIQYDLILCKGYGSVLYYAFPSMAFLVMLVFKSFRGGIILKHLSTNERTSEISFLFDIKNAYDKIATTDYAETTCYIGKSILKNENYGLEQNRKIYFIANIHSQI